MNTVGSTVRTGRRSADSAMFAPILWIPFGGLVYLLSWEVRDWSISLALTLMAALPFAIVTRWLWMTRRQALWVLAPYLFFYAVTAGSALLIEYGAYLPELDIWGEPNGTAARLLIEAALLFLTTGYWASSQRAPSTLRASTWRPRLADAVLVAFTASVLLIPVFNLVRLGAPLLVGIDRVAFYQEAGPLHLRLIVLFLAAVPSLSYIALVSTSRLISASATGLIFASLILMAMTGEKFDGLVFTIYSAALPALLLWRQAALKRIVAIAAMVLASSVALITYHYSFIYEVVNVGDFALARVAAQAEVPWAIDLEIQRGAGFGTRDFLSSELLFDASAPQGMERMMLEIAPRSFVVPFLDTGSRFTMGFPAILKMYFGSWAILIIPVFGVFAGLITRMVLHCFSEARLFALWMVMNIFGYGALLHHLLFLGNLFQLGYVELPRLAWLLLLVVGLAVPVLRLRNS